MRLLPAALAAALLPLAACGAGDPNYYRLSVWPGTPHPTAAAALLALHPTHVAAYLDRDYIVESVTDYRLHLAGNDAWAEPIGDMVGATFAADLAQRLPADHVGDATGHSDATVSLDITRFDRDASGAALLRGTLTLRDAAGAIFRSEPLDLADAATGTGSAAFTASESRLLGEVADQAAAALATVGPIPPPVSDATPAG